MRISFVYPEISSAEYINTIEAINDDIHSLNGTSFLPRLLIKFFYVVGTLVIFYIGFKLCKIIIFFVTGNGLIALLIGLLTIIFFLLVGTKFMNILYFSIRALVVRIFKIQEYEESYTFSRFTRRKSEEKYAIRLAYYYQTLEVIRKKGITDCFITALESDTCKVEISYKSENGMKVAYFKFPCHTRNDSSSKNSIIVDFERQCVVLPKEED